MVLHPDAVVMHQNKSAEVAFTVLDVLSDYMADFSAELKQTDCHNEHMSLVYQVLMELMSPSQSEAVIAVIFSILQAFVHAFGGLLFMRNPEFAGM